ncbi:MULTISPECIES: bh protein [Heyndrickxia]|jgi:hypothetical protein|uniref:bh protein n=1 Tax=Heyndrickxia TaxID=2837504 RepID=UPI000CE2A90D|nr:MULTISPECIES: bh protein [Heyndrickxia]AVD55127.1 bh protein [Heyndrickxia coagulans]MED4892586.1 bh protein [Weizmannia sp. CD-2023]MED4976894.1 bh protein [Weizmannia sp. CD-2023]UXC22943.1 bh protein [Heyndrickxia coagulans]
MKKFEMEADLYCIRCKTEVAHKVTYINDIITKIECEQCHRVIDKNIDFGKVFYQEIYNRISTKPLRLTEEYKQDLSEFLSKLPFRVITKPYRVMKDLNETRKIIVEYKTHHHN